MRRNRSRPLVLLAALAGMTGCTNYYYYGREAPVFEVPPGSRPVAVQSGSTCDVPAPSNGTIVKSSSEPCSPIGNCGPMVVSQPQGPLRSSPGSKYSWRKPEPESMATTRIEGGIDESAVR